jgi:putative spermidine/putrescine transport system permease protein
MTQSATLAANVPAAAARQRLSSGGANAALALPLTIFSIFIVFCPLVVLVIKSVSPSETAYGVSLYTAIFEDPYTVRVLLATLELGVAATLAAAIISYPIALAYMFATSFQRTLIIFLVILPLLSSSVVRAFAWIVILGRDGPLSDFLIWIGVTDQPTQMLFTHAAVIVTVTQIELPLMILPLATSLTQIDPNLISASRSLGAGYWRTFRKIIVPLSLPGLMAGCALVFASSISAFITQAVIGGGKRMYMPLLIYQRALSLNDLRSASALAIVLLVTVLVAIVFFNLLGRAKRSV